MNTLIIIAAITQHNVIGNNGAIPWHIPEEMELFKKTTMGKSVIVGRKTYESIGHALPGRKTIVVSKSLTPIFSPQLVICSSISEALSELSGTETAFVIGGSTIYAQMMPMASQMLISHIQEPYEGDSFFPPIDATIWKQDGRKEYSNFTHNTYNRI